MAKDSIRLQYKIDKSSIRNYETVKSRFPRIVDFNNLLFFVCEGIVRKGDISQQSILTKAYDPEGEYIPIHLDRSLFQAVSSYYEKCPWGLKRKALGLAMSKAIDVIADESMADEMEGYIALASTDWMDIRDIDIPSSFFSKGSDVKPKKSDADLQLDRDLETLSHTIVEKSFEPKDSDKPELEVDEDLLADLAGDFDLGESFFNEQSETL
jgi:hypothetical protein